MLRLFAKIILFLIPAVALIFSFPAYVYWKSREFTPVEQVVRAQQGAQPVLFGLAYDNASQTYKKELVNASGARVLMLGASTVYGFRSMFFKPQSAFVNASKAIAGPPDLVPFINNLSGSTSVKVIILGLEPDFFMPGNTFVYSEQVAFAERLRTFLLGSWRGVYRDYAFNNKFTLAQLNERSAASPDIGMSALINQSGFLNDGSYFDGLNELRPDHRAFLQSEIAQTIAALRQNRSSWKYGTSTDAGALSDLETFLTLCKERGITVIGFIPPQVAPLYQEMVRGNDAYTAEMDALPRTLSNLFSEHGFSFFDYTDGAVRLGIPDSEFIEEIHPGDKADLRILIAMAQQSPTLQPYVDIPELLRLLHSTPGDFVLTAVPR